jgi:lambda family phage portal protein
MSNRTREFLGRLAARHRREARGQARAAEHHRQLAFEGGFAAARQDRLTDDFNPGNLSPSSIHRADAKLLRERARDLMLNNPYAKSGVGAYVANVIECGITPKPQFEDRELRGKWTGAWDHWAASESDITGHGHLYELQALFLEEVLVAGGCLLNLVVLPQGAMRGRRLRAALELIPEERFVDDHDTFVLWFNRQKSTNVISRGVELDPATGRPVKFWIRPSSPNDTQVGLSGDPIPLPASQCHYAFLRHRIGQYRGYSALHAVILWLWKLGYYVDNELMASAIKSCFAVMLSSEDPQQVWTGLKDGDPDGAVTDVYGNLLEKLQPGIIARVLTGEKIQGVGPNVPGGDSTPWLSMIQRGISIGVDLSYEEMVRDYSQGNFSSTRASANADRKRYRPLQKFIINHFCRPVWSHFVTWGAQAGLDGFPTPADLVADMDQWLACSWRTPGWVSVNPREDAIAHNLRLADRTITREQIIAAEGGDWEDSFLQQAREEDAAEELGLSLAADAPDPRDEMQEDTEADADDR